MKKIDIARALRDPEYRGRLSEAEKSLLPAHPAGVSSLADEDLRTITGGCGPSTCNNCGPFQTTTNVSCI